MALRTLQFGAPADRAALSKAADVFVGTIRAAAGTFSSEIPPAVHKYMTRDFAWVSAGRHGGEWNWEPIHAWMFDEPHAGPIPKHPLFGNRKRWYYQPYRPFLEEGMYAGLDEAMAVYADGEQAALDYEYGFD